MTAAVEAAPARSPAEDSGGRQVPHDFPAEQAVLGGMLLSKDACAAVVELLHGDDFYRPAHAAIFDTIVTLYGAGAPVDIISVYTALMEAGDLMRVGGGPYLHTLIAAVPTAANATYYARSVADRAVQRRLIEAGMRIVDLGYRGPGDFGRSMSDLATVAQQAVYEVTAREQSEDYAPLADMLQPTLDEIEAIGARGGKMTGVPTGFIDLDRLLNGLQPGQLVVIGGRPGLGKSTLAVDITRNAAIRANQAAAIFSLEMSKVELVMRILSAESRVPLHVIRSGQLADDDWTKLARSMGEIGAAPLFLDDTPAMNLMQIRSKAQRLKQRHDLKLIVVDYLQLMSLGSRADSRQQEVSEISRGLKLLAKEMECPVIAVSQLNRGPEQRQDKRPQLSDIRESGCLTADTSLLRADTGAPITFEALLRDGFDGVTVWSLDAHRRMVAAPITNVFPSGVRQVYRLTLASGRTVKATASHKFLTFGGWQTLGSLKVRDRLAVPRQIPPPSTAGLGWSANRLGLLAHLLGDGCVLPRQPLHYTSEDEANLSFVEAAANAEFGITARRVAQGNWHHTYLPAPFRLTHGRRNPIHQWFRNLGIDGLRSHEKRLPDALHKANDDEIRVFLHHLWATDGSISTPGPNTKKGVWNVYYATSSRRLADGVAHLLGRLGIVARISTVAHKLSKRPGYHVIIGGLADRRQFCAEVGIHGSRGAKAQAFLAAHADVKAGTNVDTLPREVWDLVADERYRIGLTERAFQAALGTKYCGSSLYKACPSRERLMRCAEVLDSELLRAAASDDVFWDRVIAIEPLGEEPVFDATVEGTHNFIADGIVAHNSIEQDADIVLLLHRDDYYDKESARAGEADVIVAKHRNGPTDTITVAAQLHLSRFVDMAIV